MNAMLALATPRTSSSPMGAFALPPAPGAARSRIVEDDTTPPRAVVHAINLSAGVFKFHSRLLASIGVEMKTYMNVGAYLNADQPDEPGCLIVDPRGQLRCQQRGMRVPMVVVADQAEVRMAVLAMKAGAVDFLQNPLREQD